MKLENARQKDKEAHNLDMEKIKMNHEENKIKMQNTHEINRKNADNETMRIKGKIELDLENAREANKRGMKELDDKSNLEKLKINNEFSLKNKEINNIKVKNDQEHEKNMVQIMMKK